MSDEETLKRKKKIGINGKILHKRLTWGLKKNEARQDEQNAVIH